MFMYFGNGSVASEGALFSLVVSNCTKAYLNLTNCTSDTDAHCIYEHVCGAVTQTQQFYGNGTGLWVDVPTSPVFVVAIYLTQTFANQAYSLFYKEGIYIQYPG